MFLLYVEIKQEVLEEEYDDMSNHDIKQELLSDEETFNMDSM